MHLADFGTYGRAELAKFVTKRRHTESHLLGFLEVEGLFMLGKMITP